MTTQAPHAGYLAEWLHEFDHSDPTSATDGLIRVEDYNPIGRPPEEVAVLERARAYEAHSVFFEAGRNGRAPTPQAFLYASIDGSDDEHFAQLHKRLWNWGGVPLIYRKVPGQIQLFRCAHDPDFISDHGIPVCRPFRILHVGVRVANLDAWWSAEQLRNGTLWDDPRTCRLMLSSERAAHRNLVEAVRALYKRLTEERLLTPALRRRLLILTILIAYLEEREVFPPYFFATFLPNATRFFDILGDAQALTVLLNKLETRFNGNIFSLTNDESTALHASEQLDDFARLVKGYEEPNGQISFWRLYSFKDLPIELLSNIYQIFVDDTTSSVYTPPSLVRLMLDEALPWERMDHLIAQGEVILDPACGSGVFLVEAYRRLVLHWRNRNSWTKPSISDLKTLLNCVYGFDVEEAAVELAGFSLCLALCDSLEPDDIRASVSLFPRLAGVTIHHTCFFAAKECFPINKPVGAIVGNPPFKSKLTTPAAHRSYKAYKATHGHFLADKQLAYLFLHDAMDVLSRDGVLCMVQPSGFLYNQYTKEFRQNLLKHWAVPEILDFVSVRGLFRKGQADPKVVIVLALSRKPDSHSATLHAVFRRNGRATAEQGFDVDYYDLFWLQNKYLLDNSDIWRSNLFGGGRFHDFIKRLRAFRTLGDYAREKGWDSGEGYIAGKRGISRPAGHLIGKHFLPTKALGSNGLDASAIIQAPEEDVEVPRTARRFTPPMLLVKLHENLYHAIWNKHYLTYKHKIVGFAAPPTDFSDLLNVDRWISENSKALQAYTAGISLQLLSQRATAIGSADIKALPYPKDMSLHLSENEQIIIDDAAEFGREFIRRGSNAKISRTATAGELAAFVDTFAAQIDAVYTDCPIRSFDAYRWPGVICQPFSFGDGKIDWAGADQLKGKLDQLLKEVRGSTLTVTRIARIYDGTFVFLLKPDSLRFWLRSIALRDADDVRADLRAQGL